MLWWTNVFIAETTMLDLAPKELWIGEPCGSPSAFQLVIWWPILGVGLYWKSCRNIFHPTYVGWVQPALDQPLPPRSDLLPSLSLCCTSNDRRTKTVHTHKQFLHKLIFEDTIGYGIIELFYRIPNPRPEQWARGWDWGFLIIYQVIK